LIDGKPMVEHVYRRTTEARTVDVVVVATDDSRVADAIDQIGGIAVMTDPEHATGTDRLAEVARALTSDLVVNVQGDEPLIDPGLIDACAELLAQHPECVMSTAAHAIDTLEDLDNTNVVKVVLDAAGRALYFSRAPIPWWRDARAAGTNPLPTAVAPLRHMGLYAYQAGFLRGFPKLAISPIETIEALEQLRVLWHGHRIAVHVSDTRPGPGVDTPEDLARVRALFA
jgi:3-deoxy-manno-octulosonate cytidylyltransferase (CMP-KDO synthetase)